MTRRAPTAALLAGLALTLGGCSNPIGDDETDRVIDVVSDAIVYPRQEDAAGLARAALATGAAHRGILQVLEYTDLPHEDTDYLEPRSRLLVRVRHEGSNQGFSETKTVVACYSITFNWYMAVDGPERIDCPRDARPVTPPPAPPGPTFNPEAGG